MPHPGPRAQATHAGALMETLSLTDAARRPDLALVATLDAGSIGLVHGDRLVHAGHVEVQVFNIPLLALTNGDETAMLLFSQSGAVLPAGRYELRAVLDRDRWSSTSGADPEQHYHEACTLSFRW